MSETQNKIYRSHTGKTKDGETYEKFLSPKEYDEKLLSFEKFLHASFCKYINWYLSLT